MVMYNTNYRAYILAVVETLNKPAHIFVYFFFLFVCFFVVFVGFGGGGEKKNINGCKKN